MTRPTKTSPSDSVHTGQMRIIASPEMAAELIAALRSSPTLTVVRVSRALTAGQTGQVRQYVRLTSEPAE